MTRERTAEEVEREAWPYVEEARRWARTLPREVLESSEILVTGWEGVHNGALGEQIAAMPREMALETAAAWPEMAAVLAHPARRGSFRIVVMLPDAIYFATFALVPGEMDFGDAQRGPGEPTPEEAA